MCAVSILFGCARAELDFNPATKTVIVHIWQQKGNSRVVRVGSSYIQPEHTKLASYEANLLTVTIYVFMHTDAWWKT